jgi:hypothetical protein
VDNLKNSRWGYANWEQAYTRQDDAGRVIRVIRVIRVTRDNRVLRVIRVY